MSITVNGTNGLTFNDGSAQNTAATGFGFKNRIINGAMGIWQRGTSGFTSGYFVDRFFLGGTISAAAQSTDVPTGFKYSASVSGSNYPVVYQRIESVNTTDLSGANVTISFWLKQSTGAGTGAIAVGLFYPTAADNYTSSTQIGSYQSINTTSSWAQYTVTFTGLPSGVVNGLALSIGSSSAGSSVTLVTGVQLEKGSTATAYDYRPYSTELALCQRYYWRYVTGAQAYSNFGLGYASSSTNAYILIKNPVPMRIPATSIDVSAASTFNYNYGTSPTLVANALGIDYTVLQLTGSGMASGYAVPLFGNNNTNAYVGASAEL